MTTSAERRAAVLTTVLFLIATALIGLAQAAFMPPWEGFDETAHWSYIQQWADTGHAPRYGADGLSRDIDAYLGPMTYSGAAPFDRTSHLTFRSYQQSGARPIRGGPTRYVSDGNLNWQAQHPPLYYALMAPLYRLSHGLGWVGHLLALRLASEALALTGFALGVLATAQAASRPASASNLRLGLWTAPIMAAWPFLFPQFFPQFARLGNDSLCLLLVGGAWALILRLLLGDGRWASAAGLGAILGLGLLTKAFFLPIGASVGLLLLLRWWSGGRRRDHLADAALAGAVALAIGGWWYLQRTLQTGSITGADEFIKLKQAGGIGALADGFSITELGRGLWLIVSTFVWAGTWSLAVLPEWLMVAPLALLALILVDYGLSLRGRGANRACLLAWTPLILAVPMAAGLIYHVFVWMAGTSAFTPGWYFHILAAPLGFAAARGWRRPRLLTILAGLTGLYTAIAWAFQLSMFSGCAAKLGSDPHYSLHGASCFVDPHALAALGHPVLGAVALTLGGTCAIAGAGVAVRAYRF